MTTTNTHIAESVAQRNFARWRIQQAMKRGKMHEILAIKKSENEHRPNSVAARVKITFSKGHIHATRG